MIGEQQARRLATVVLGGADLALEPFEQGWVVTRVRTESRRGAGTVVVTRDTSEVLLFPSSVPPRRLTQEFDRLRDRGLPMTSEDQDTT